MLGSNGFTMVEVVIAMAILTLTMVVGVAAFTNMIQMQQKNETIRNVQQTTRYVSEMIARDIRNANNYELTHDPVQLTLPNSLTEDERSVRYTYVESSDGENHIYRVRCGDSCPESIDAGSHITSGIRVRDFDLEPLETTQFQVNAPLRITLETGHEDPSLEETDVFFYEYNSTTMAVPRR